MAQGLMSHALKAEPPPLNRVIVGSFGLSAFPGSPASQNTRHVLNQVGIDISGHRSRNPDQIDTDEVLAYFCMTEAHCQSLVDFYQIDPEKVLLVREFVEGEKDIPDPFGMGVQHYFACRDAILESVPSLLQFLRERLT